MENQNELSIGARSYLAEQWRMFVLGLRAINGVTWINDPTANAAAEAKIVQLAAAVRVGLRVPATRITNDLKAARRLGPPVVAKSLASALIEEPDANYFIYTTDVDLSNATSEEIQLAPVIFQQRLWPKEDYRVTIVGSRVLSAKIPEGVPRPLDWRATHEPPQFHCATLPQHVETRLLALMRALNLRFGAVDLCQADGDFFFLEVNPNGEWGWLETSIGLPIADAIVDELCAASSQQPVA
jgi:glutathione synthase/RimK-type ligase-like ATP-grasp enzyme